MKYRISQVGHVELADGAVGAAETVEQHLLVVALGHSVQLRLQNLDSFAIAGDGIVSALGVREQRHSHLELSQIHPLFEVVLRVLLRALYKQLRRGKRRDGETQYVRGRRFRRRPYPSGCWL